MSRLEIEILKEGTVMMRALQKVGWIVLKSGYNITPYYALENNLYDLNIEHSSTKNN